MHFTHKTLWLLAALALWSACAPAPGETVEVPAGTKLQVIVNSDMVDLGDEYKPGDTFEAVLDQPIEVENQLAAPAGIMVLGQFVKSQKKAGTEAKPETASDARSRRVPLDMVLNRIIIQDHYYAIHTARVPFDPAQWHVAKDSMTFESAHSLAFVLSKPVKLPVYEPPE